MLEKVWKKNYSIHMLKNFNDSGTLFQVELNTSVVKILNWNNTRKRTFFGEKNYRYKTNNKKFRNSNHRVSKKCFESIENVFKKTQKMRGKLKFFHKRWSEYNNQA